MIVDVIQIIGGVLSGIGVSWVLTRNKLSDNAYKQLLKILCLEWLILIAYSIGLDVLEVFVSYDCKNGQNSNCPLSILIGISIGDTLYYFWFVLSIVMAYISWSLVGDSGSLDKIPVKVIVLVTSIVASINLLDPIPFDITKGLLILNLCINYFVLFPVAIVSSIRTWFRLRHITKSRQNPLGRTSLTILSTKNFNTYVTIAKVSYILTGIISVLSLLFVSFVILFVILEVDQQPKLPALFLHLANVRVTIQRYNGVVFAIGMYMIMNGPEQTSNGQSSPSYKENVNSPPMQQDRSLSTDASISIDGTTDNQSYGLDSNNTTHSITPLNHK
ncbi:hypothetical protein BC833DRAFT_608431 [Globomyces pollinis-pini]|nr:hypothetical protein BC833DRAFT_608431 [Globomyces pollinis-pini]